MLSDGANGAAGLHSSTTMPNGATPWAARTEEYVAVGLTGYDIGDRGTLARARPLDIGAPVRVEAPANAFVRTLLERFALVAFALYHLPLFFNNYPSLGGGGFREHGVAVSWGHVFTRPGVWVAQHIFHVAGPMPAAYNGDNGDVAEEFGRLLLCIVIGAAAAAAWTLIERRKARSPPVPATPHVLLR